MLVHTHNRETCTHNRETCAHNRKTFTRNGEKTRSVLRSGHVTPIINIKQKSVKFGPNLTYRRRQWHL